MGGKANSKVEAKQILIVIESFSQAYFIDDHRAEIGRVDDEAIIDIRGAMVQCSDNLRQLEGRPAEVSLVCSRQYHSAPELSGPEHPMLMTASVRKGVFQALAYLPSLPFWALPEMIASAKVTHVIADYRTGPGRESKLNSLYFSSHATIERQGLADLDERART